jgi:hypothetical protein
MARRELIEDRLIISSSAGFLIIVAPIPNLVTIAIHSRVWLFPLVAPGARAVPGHAAGRFGFSRFFKAPGLLR